MPHAYISLTDLKARLAITDTTDDTALRQAIESASAALDNAYNRRFQPYTATRYYTAERAGWLPVDDLLAVTTLKTLTTNSNGTRTYGNTWSSTDYDLLPYDAADEREPYTRIETNPAGAYSFPTERRGVEIAGTWGYCLDTVQVGTLGAAISDTTGLTVTMSSSPTGEALQTLLIDSEQVYLTSVSGTTYTLDGRGANGTTAATHLISTAVYAYRYPAPVVEAAALLAARYFRRKDAPFGMVGSPEAGIERIAATDPDVKRLMQPYARFLMAGV